MLLSINKHTSQFIALMYEIMCWHGRYIAEQALEDAVESSIYMCGMPAIGEGSSCHDIFKCDPELSCVDAMEADFYASKRSLIAAKSFIKDLSICSICAGTSHDPEGGKIDKVLKTVYANVLPICDTCKSQGAKTLVGRHNHNGKTIQQHLDKQRREEALAARRE
jgi:hypothetical protein